jgi:hypothetical protein
MTRNSKANQPGPSDCPWVQIEPALEDGRMRLVCRKLWFWIIDANGMIGTRK